MLQNMYKTTTKDNIGVQTEYTILITTLDGL